MRGIEYSLTPVAWDQEGNVVEWKRSAVGAEIDEFTWEEYLMVSIEACGPVRVFVEPGNVQDGGDGVLIVPDDEHCKAWLFIKAKDECPAGGVFGGTWSP